MIDKSKIAQITYINLDHRLDRREHMERQLATSGFHYHRLSATRLSCDPEDAGLRMIPRLAGKRGVASIWLSHRRALEEIVATYSEGTSQSFVVLEDDVVISGDFWSAKLLTDSKLDNDWQMLMLTPKYRWRDPAQAPEDEKDRKFAKPPNGGKPTLLSVALKTYIVSGAHFCIFRDLESVKSILARMHATKEIYDVDLFYARETRAYGLRIQSVSSGGYGSDHE